MSLVVFQDMIRTIYESIKECLMCFNPDYQPEGRSSARQLQQPDEHDVSQQLETQLIMFRKNLDHLNGLINQMTISLGQVRKANAELKESVTQEVITNLMQYRQQKYTKAKTTLNVPTEQLLSIENACNQESSTDPCVSTLQKSPNLQTSMDTDMFILRPADDEANL